MIPIKVCWDVKVEYEKCTVGWRGFILPTNVGRRSENTSPKIRKTQWLGIKGQLGGGNSDFQMGFTLPEPGNVCRGRRNAVTLTLANKRP